MNKVLCFLCFFVFSLDVSAQQLSQYNTETLFDSFENPSQRSFIPDSSRRFAFNFLIPNFDANTYLTGNIQQGIKSRLFGNPAYYNTSALQIGKGKYNHFEAGANAYLFMFKMFNSLSGDVELGLSAQIKVESRGFFSDESLALFGGPANFPLSNYEGIFNDKYNYQSYHQLSFSYRERIDDKLAVGFKISGLLGIQYQQIDIDQSRIALDKIKDKALLTLRGQYLNNNSGSGFGPSLHNPGAAITVGTSYKTDDGIIIQTNLKDLGFIHWSRSNANSFNSSVLLNNISSEFREDTIYQGVEKLFKKNEIVRSFTSATDARAEVSTAKTYWLDEYNDCKFLPTLLLSKKLFDAGFTGALINRFQYRNLNFSLSGSYDDMRFFNLGAQLMIKSPNAEFFIGSDRLINTGKLASAAFNYAQINNASNYTGGDLFLGFSLKFGPVIEHSMNTSIIPMGGDSDRGFFGRLFDYVF